jgi:hypothetical protein
MLSATHLLFDTEVERPISLNEHKGSALRGAFFHALRGRPAHQRWRGFCANQTAPECRDCMLLAACPVARLLATHDPTGARGHEIPRPVTVKPPTTDKVDYLPGERLRFGLTIIGDALNLLPYVIMAVQQGMPAEGLGKRDRLNDFRPGHFRLLSAHAYHPLREQSQVLWQDGERMVQSPDLPVTHEQILEHARALPTDRLTLRLRTPMRLIEQKRLVHSFRFRPFFQRLMERLILLSSTVGQGSLLPDPDERQRLLAAADEIKVDDRTDWVEVRSYSTRRNGETMLSGLRGEVTLTGDLAPFLPWLLWGAQVHVGKDAVKGDGWYELRTGEGVRG